MEKQSLDNLRHSCAHLLAAAVLELWPHAKRTIGPPIENGFYYDFDFGDTKISDDDLPKIEEKMRAILPSWKGFERQEVSGEEAKKIFAGNEYKKELIDEFSTGGQTLTLYTSGSYTDLCRGGHSERPSEELQHFKLLSLAGAYWRGSEKNKMLTRIYGTCFPTQQELESHLHNLEEAKKRDHKKLGKELDIYMFSDLVGPGLPLYTAKGTVIVQEIENFMKTEQKKLGYDLVLTPNIAKGELYEKSGHLQWFKDGMFPPMVFDGEGEYYAKPMNCPHHIQIFKNKMRSYRDLPIRYAEFGTVYRYEQSGEINGLLRTRGFTQDDAHIFCREDQIVDEFLRVFDLTSTLLKGLGLNTYWYRLSLGGSEKEKYAGNEDQWEKATQYIKQALQQKNITYTEAIGEAAFYGPKLDIIFQDSLGRDWQISTIQVDFLQPERFDLHYINEEGKEVRPYMVHRAPLGSRERIMAILLEHYMGAYPVWLSPVQVQFVPVSQKHLDGAEALKKEFEAADVRAAIDIADETVGNKVRKAVQQKVPYIVVVGDKELSGEEWSIRVRGSEDPVKKSKDVFLADVQREIKDRA